MAKPRTKVVHSRKESVRLVAVPDELVKRLALSAANRYMGYIDDAEEYFTSRYKQIIEDYTKETQK